MQTKQMKWMLMICLAGAFAAVAGPARAGVSDAWISTKVKMLLLNSPMVSGLPIDVDTDERRVTLHGKVPSAAEKGEAERIARASTGVESVRNLLQVVPASRQKAVEVADARLEELVKAALDGEPALENSSIKSKSVNKGVVLLAGKAASLSDHLLAMETVAVVPGVHRVASEVESPDEFGDREIWADLPATTPVRGNMFTDGWITTQTKMKFMTDADIPAGDINVDTRRGVVTLFGTVPNNAVGQKATRVATAVHGVKKVNTQLRVVAPSMKKAASANDGEIASSVRERIANAKFEGADVQVEVKAGTARLSGHVQQASHRYAAVSIAHATPGVARVLNDLRVEETTSTQR